MRAYKVALDGNDATPFSAYIFIGSVSGLGWWRGVGDFSTRKEALAHARTAAKARAKSQMTTATENPK